MTDSTQESKGRRTSWQSPALFALGLTLATIFGFLLYQHFENLEGRITSLQGQLREGLEEVRQASEHSQRGSGRRAPAKLVSGL